ncbi:hypothetical protein HUW51_17060 [Adhaeribacter swui]|uniref:Uncharacterized protein n=1 Tax=Adhaeribacter swui TaxID=2086471 RepID=A0A7G7GB14_9BACT|nr:hypothetical protein [Adhaeribacter swui]QNF34348.1 hypothetical protein HUW51_17060 [Adhaeribacter swui]
MLYTFLYKGKDFTAQLGEKPRYIQVDDHTGPITRYQVKDVRIGMDLETIVVEYIPVLVDILGEIRSAFEIKTFVATSQENWQYFYEYARSGEQIEKMIINGLLIHLEGVTMFNPYTGELELPLDTEPTTE